jgi:hypothetical protein
MERRGARTVVVDTKAAFGLGPARGAPPSLRARLDLRGADGRVEAGVPFVYFGVEDHKDYHKTSDDFDTLTRDFFVGAAETVLEAVRALDADLDAIVSAPKAKRST